MNTTNQTLWLKWRTAGLICRKSHHVAALTVWTLHSCYYSRSPPGTTQTPLGEMVWSIWNESWSHLKKEQTLKAIHNPVKSKCTSKV